MRTVVSTMSDVTGAATSNASAAYDNQPADQLPSTGTSTPRSARLRANGIREAHRIQSA
jgi:hypothetical protein